SIATTAADWFASSYGKPGPSIQFSTPAGVSTDGEVRITAGGATFQFQSVDLYSSTTPIPYVFTGIAKSATVYVVSGRQGNTFGNFATIATGQSSTPIDTLLIRLTNAAAVCCANHMGEIEIAGRDALAAVQRISSNDASRLQVGQAQYSGLLSPRGTFVDDLLVYRLAPAHFLLVVNAGNIAKDYAWIAEQIKPVGDAVAVDASSRYALLAIQGPAAKEILQPLTAVELDSIKYYWFSHGEVAS